MINDEAKKYYYFAVKSLLEFFCSQCLKSKKDAIINNDNTFQNALNDALDYQNIETNPQRISKIKLYDSKYNWEGIEFLPGSKDWRKDEQNNKTIALNILFVPYNTETIRVAYRPKYNHKHSDSNKWYYFVVSYLSALLAKEIIKSSRRFILFNCFKSYTTKNRLEKPEEICNKHDSCRIEMPKWFEKILKYNPGEKSLRAPFVIYIDLECLLKK